MIFQGFFLRLILADKATQIFGTGVCRNLSESPDQCPPPTIGQLEINLGLITYLGGCYLLNLESEIEDRVLWEMFDYEFFEERYTNVRIVDLRDNNNEKTIEIQSRSLYQILLRRIKIVKFVWHVCLPGVIPTEIRRRPPLAVLWVRPKSRFSDCILRK